MKLQSIFVGKPREITYNNRTVLTSIFKEAVAGPVGVKRHNIVGDQQSDLSVHGGANKAVYAYPAEHYAFWESERPDLAFPPGAFGENLSTIGLSEDEVCIGDAYKIGSAVIAVTEPRFPCVKLGVKMGDPKFVKAFMDAQRTGFYFKVIQEGTIEAGEAIVKTEDDGYGLRVADVARLYTTHKGDTQLLGKVLAAPSLPESWKTYFGQRGK